MSTERRGATDSQGGRHIIINRAVVPRTILHIQVTLSNYGLFTPGYIAERACREELLDLAGIFKFFALNSLFLSDLAEIKFK
jgi:hypothetical protein